MLALDLAGHSKDIAIRTVDGEFKIILGLKSNNREVK